MHQAMVTVDEQSQFNILNSDSGGVLPTKKSVALKLVHRDPVMIFLFWYISSCDHLNKASFP